MSADAINEALEKFGDKATSLTQIVHKDLKKYYIEMQDAVKTQNAEEAIIAAHSCKSICALINMPDAMHIVRTMEQAAREGDLSGYEMLLESYTPLYKEIISHLDDVLSKAA